MGSLDTGKATAHLKQAFIGRVFGRMALRGMTKDDKPLARNVPTSREFRITDKRGMSLPND